MLTVAGIRQMFMNMKANKDFVYCERSNSSMLEILGASFIADECSIFGTVNQDYIDAELEWYASMSLNVNDLPAPVPAAWVATANDEGLINSNYGYLIHSQANGNQYYNALNTLLEDKNSRRAIMIYNRPSMHSDYCEYGKNDFVCTNAVAYYIRDMKLHAVVQMRSNDVVYGYKNDYAWQKSIQLRLHHNLTIKYPQLEVGDLHWQVQSLHVYQRNFNLVL